MERRRQQQLELDMGEINGVPMDTPIGKILEKAQVAMEARSKRKVSKAASGAAAKAKKELSSLLNEI